MFRVYHRVAKSEEIIKQTGHRQGNKTIPEYVQGVIPHLNRTRSTDHDKQRYIWFLSSGSFHCFRCDQRYLLLGLTDDSFRAAVAFCESTPDNLFPSVGGVGGVGQAHPQGGYTMSIVCLMCIS